MFIEPHGMVHAEAYKHDDKARLHETLPALAKVMCDRAKLKHVWMDSFIISATRFEDLRNTYDDGTWDRKRFTEAHILFPEPTKQYDYLATIMRQQEA